MESQFKYKLKKKKTKKKRKNEVTESTNEGDKDREVIQTVFEENKTFINSNPALPLLIPRVDKEADVLSFEEIKKFIKSKKAAS